MSRRYISSVPQGHTRRKPGSENQGFAQPSEKDAQTAGLPVCHENDIS